MLMVVVVVFFVCNILALIINILEVFKINIIALNNTSNLLVTFNSSVNLIIYCIFGDKFKRVFIGLFCPAFLKRPLVDKTFVTKYPMQILAKEGPEGLRPETLPASRARLGIEDAYNDSEDEYEDPEVRVRSSIKTCQCQAKLQPSKRLTQLKRHTVSIFLQENVNKNMNFLQEKAENPSFF